MTTAILNDLLAGRDLDFERARGLMAAIMDGEVDPVRLAALLVALRAKGETSDEIAGCARAMRDHSLRIEPARRGLVDTCGTGGDGLATFNISTATALVVAAMGIGVAKHGNRAVSSKCGSADVLEELGVDLDLEPEEVAGLIDDIGIGFLFAPHLHPAMAHAAPTRRALGVRTIFNLLGPLTNPAGVRRQLLGVFAPELCETMARVLRDLGAVRAFVVHGADGSDEVSLCGSTRVAELRDGEIRCYDFTPEEAGLRRAKPGELTGGDAAHNARIVTEVLAGRPGAPLDAVLLNSAFVAVLSDRCAAVGEGVELARAVIGDGRASILLETLRRESIACRKEAS